MSHPESKTNLAECFLVLLYLKMGHHLLTYFFLSFNTFKTPHHVTQLIQTVKKILNAKNAFSFSLPFLTSLKALQSQHHFPHASSASFIPESPILVV